jgi:hypothetical protein
MGEFLHRANGILKFKLNSLGIIFETWDIQATQLRFEWGGHVARMKINDPNRLTYRIFKHWDYNMIVSKIEAHNNGRQLHNRHVHVWRWEYVMYKFIGIDWQEFAQDRDVYKDKVFFAKYEATKGAVTFQS